MTREDESPSVVRRLVVVFDICSSTTILEDLKRTDNLAVWRNLLIRLKQCLLDGVREMGMELYKFVGDGWVLLFPDRVRKDKLCEFLRTLSKWFDTTFDYEISNLLEHRPDPIGLTFGIDSGELIRVEMNEQWEYIGRPINVASRLQGQAKEVPGGPAYKALFSKSSFYSQPRPPANIEVHPLEVSLRNISHGDRYSALVFKTYESPAYPSAFVQGDKAGLEIVFEGDRKPYLEEQFKAARPGGKLIDRRYRVGVRNSTTKVVPNARIVLENCEPSEHHGIHLEQALQVMGGPRRSEALVQPGNRVSAYFDVVYDETLGGKLHDDGFGLCYASPRLLYAIPRGSYVLTLRVEGDGMLSRKKFRIYQESTTQMLTMREVTKHQ